jgi:hypothetical protein
VEGAFFGLTDSGPLEEAVPFGIEGGIFADGPFGIPCA